MICIFKRFNNKINSEFVISTTSVLWHCHFSVAGVFNANKFMRISLHMNVFNKLASILTNLETIDVAGEKYRILQNVYVNIP